MAVVSRRTPALVSHNVVVIKQYEGEVMGVIIVINSFINIREVMMLFSCDPLVRDLT
jgi:hypothetical protein